MFGFGCYGQNDPSMNHQLEERLCNKTSQERSGKQEMLFQLCSNGKVIENNLLHFNSEKLLNFEFNNRCLFGHFGLYLSLCFVKMSLMNSVHLQTFSLQL